MLLEVLSGPADAVSLGVGQDLEIEVVAVDVLVAEFIRLTDLVPTVGEVLIDREAACDTERDDESASRVSVSLSELLWLLEILSVADMEAVLTETDC